MNGDAFIALFYFGAGLMFWPVFQIFHRRWTPCAKRLLAVFLSTLALLIGYAVFLVVNWGGHGWLLLLLVFPLLNSLSLVVSFSIWVVSLGSIARPPEEPAMPQDNFNAQ